jgi:surface antigen
MPCRLENNVTSAPLVIAAAVLVLAAGPGRAANLGFLGDAPISRMTEQDVDILYKSVMDTLEHSENNAQVGWDNPATGAGGVLVPLDEFKGPAGQRCRHLQVNNHAGGLRNKHVLTLCKQPDGEWKLQAE